MCFLHGLLPQGRHYDLKIHNPVLHINNQQNCLREIIFLIGQTVFICVNARPIALTQKIFTYICHRLSNTSSIPGISACSGDSGGPFACPNEVTLFLQTILIIISSNTTIILIKNLLLTLIRSHPYKKNRHLTISLPSQSSTFLTTFSSPSSSWRWWYL